MSEEIKPGDVVQLKSGGEPMTAGRFVGTPSDPQDRKFIRCWWFADGEIREWNLPVEALKKTEGV